MLKRMYLRRTKNVGTQIGERENFEFFAMLSKTKCLHLRYSDRMRDYVVELTFSNLKHYILNRSEWQKFTTFFNTINNVFRQKRILYNKLKKKKRLNKAQLNQQPQTLYIKL